MIFSLVFSEDGEFKNILLIKHICAHESILIPKVCIMHVVTTTNKDSVSGLCENLVQDFS